MSKETTGITKKEAEEAIQTIIESAHVLLGYHNTFAFDTVSRKLRLLKESGKDIDGLLGGDIVELLGEDCNITEERKKELKDQLENHLKQISSFIDIRSTLVEIIERAEIIQKSQEGVTYLKPDQ